MARIGRGIQQQGITSVGPDIGVRDPIVILPLPTLRMQTVSTVLQAVNRIQAAYQRRAPFSRLPLVIPPTPPTLAQQTIGVTLAGRTRREQQRRFPLQGFEYDPSSETGPAPVTQSLSSGPGQINSYSNFGDTTSEARLAQEFASIRGNVTSVAAYLIKNGSPVDNLVAEIQSDAGGQPSGVILATSNAVAGSSVTAGGALVTFTFPSSGDIVAPAWLVIRRTGAVDAANYYGWRVQSPPTSQGPKATFDSGASAWTPDPFSYLTATVFFTPFASAMRLQRRFLGPRPPLVVSPLPSQQQQTVQVSLAAMSRRNTEKRRFPLQGWEGWGTVDALSGFTTKQEQGTLGGNNSSVGAIASKIAVGTQFTGVTGSLDYVDVPVSVQGSPSDNLVVEIRPDSGGSPSNTVLATGSIAGGSLSSSRQFIRVSTAGLSLSAAATYWIVLRRDGATDAANFYLWGNTNPPTSQNEIFDGATWSPSGDHAFWILGYEAPAGSKSVHQYQRLLGPRPPLVVNPLPSQQQQTVQVSLTALQSRRSTEKRRFPLQGWEEVPSSVIAVDNETGTLGSAANFSGAGGTNENYAQSYTPRSDISSIASVVFHVARLSNPTDTLVVDVCADASGVPGTVLGTSAAITGSGLPTAPGVDVSFQFGAPVSIAGLTKVWLVLRRTGARDTTNRYSLFANSDGYAGGNLFVSTSGVYADFGTDASFSVSGLASVVTLVQPFLGPRRPLVLLPRVPTAQQQTIVRALGVAQFRRNTEQQRAPHSRFAGPVLVTPGGGGPPVVTEILTALVKTKPRPTHPRFAGPILVAAPTLFFGPDVTLATDLRTRRFSVRREPFSKLSPPAVVEPSLRPPDRRLEIAVTLAGRTRREQQRRFPLQGWEGWGAIDVLSGFSVFDSGGSLSASSVPLGDVSTRQQFAFAFASTSGTESDYGNFVWIEVALSATGTPSDNTILQLQQGPLGGTSPTGPIVATASIPNTSLSSTLTLYRFQVPAAQYANFKYWIILSRSGALDAANFINVARNGAAGSYYYFDGATWTHITGLGTAVYRVAVVIPGGSLSFYSIKRNLGPWPPLLQTPLPSQQQQTITVTNQAVASRRATAVRREPFSRLSPPAVTTAATAPPIQTNLVDNREHGLGRRHFPASVLESPTVLQIFKGPSVTQASNRRRLPTFSRLAPTAVVAAFVAAPIQTRLAHTRPRATSYGIGPPLLTTRTPTYQQTLISATVVRTRPRRTVAHLSPPTVVATGQVFFGPFVHVIQTRPRPVAALVLPPTVVRVPSVEQQEDTIRVTLVRTRPRHTLTTAHAVTPPTVLQTFAGPTVFTVKTRPRHTISRLQPPTVVIPQGQVYYGPYVKTVRTRPRHTIADVFPPTTLQVFRGPVETEVAVRIPVEDRRRGIHSRLAPPTVIDTVLVRQERIVLTKTRPRPTSKFVGEPTVLQTFRGPTVALVRTRRRPTTKTLFEPTTLQVFFGPVVALTKTRPRPTRKFLLPPTVVRIPSVEQREDTITVALAKIRPRPTVKFVGEPTVLSVFTGPSTHLIRTRPRPTIHTLGAPTVVRVPSVEQREQTITTWLVRTRPRPTAKALRPPTVIRVPSVEQLEQTIRVALTRTRPRPTTRKLAPPTVIVVNPPVVTTTRVTLALRPRIEAQRRISRYHLGPPTAVIPLPTQQMQTIKVALVRIRPRPTIKTLRKPTVLQVFPGPQITLARIRPRPTTHRYIAPYLFKATSKIAVTLAGQTRLDLRRRAPHLFLGKPTVLQVFPGPQITLVHTRPRPTTKFVAEPTVVRTAAFFGPEVTLAKIRPRPTTTTLSPPTVITRPTFEGPTVALVRTRPRPIVVTLGPPTALAVFAGPATHLVRTRPRATTATLAPPTVVRVPSVEQRLRTITTALVRTRPRPTTHLLFPIPPPKPVVTEILSILDRIRPQPTQALLLPIPPRPPERVIESVIRTTLAQPLDLRRVRSKLEPPTVVFPPPTPDETTIRVVLAVLKRIDRIRRGPHSKLFPPAVINPSAPGFVSLDNVPGDAAEIADVGADAAEVGSSFGDVAELGNTADDASSIDAVGGSRAEVSDQHGGIPL